MWSFDEHRIGLIPILRRVWARKGSRPVVPYRTRYEWVYVYGFVCPQTGETFWLLLPTVNLEVFELSLNEFAKAVGAGKEKHVIVVLDGAGFHKENSITVPEGIHLIFLPAYSPELQPAEKLWPVSNEGIANQWFPTIESLENAQEKRCRKLIGMKDEIRERCLFSWWPIIKNNSS